MPPTIGHQEKDQGPDQLRPPQPRCEESRKYLGVELTESLHWGKQVKAAVAKANGLSAFTYRNLKGCSAVVQTHCFKGLARPVLEYAFVVWDPHQ